VVDAGPGLRFGDGLMSFAGLTHGYLTGGPPFGAQFEAAHAHLLLDSRSGGHEPADGVGISGDDLVGCCTRTAEAARSRGDGCPKQVFSVKTPVGRNARRGIRQGAASFSSTLQCAKVSARRQWTAQPGTLRSRRSTPGALPSL